MASTSGHKHSSSVSQNQKAQLASAYNELGKELSSSKLKVIGNYTLGRTIGEGAYGKVRIGTHRVTGSKVAIKQIPKAMSASLTREIHHHRQLHHLHVTQMYEVIATEASVWIVTELCSGGELFDYLVEKSRLEEIEARVIFGQLCLAVAYLHDKGIVHRDLKLENVLLDEKCRVKLGDFGFTREFEKGSFMETFCGTTGYASPEMLEGKRYTGPEVDVWSLGVILYCLLTGTLPFDDDDERVMREKIIIGDFEDPTWLSQDCRNLIKGILEKDTAKRSTIPQILAHSWFTTPPHHDAPAAVSPQMTHSHTELLLPPLSKAAPLSSSVESSNQDSTRSSEASIHSDSATSSDIYTSAPTTPDDTTQSQQDPFDTHYLETKYKLRNRSDATISAKQTVEQTDDGKSSVTKPGERPETVLEEEDGDTLGVPRRMDSTSSFSRAPPIHTVRTPARTKRRSVSSTLSDPLGSPTAERTPSLPVAQDHVNFASLLSTPAPIIFSTPIERQLLNTLSTLGFDLGQIVYSVLNDACDAAGALWWLLLKKAERKAIDPDEQEPSTALPTDAHFHIPAVHKRYAKASVQTDPIHLSAHHSMPQLGLVPPTPTARTFTPPPISPTRSSYGLSPSSSLLDTRSNPSTPNKGDPKGGRKARSGSVSIMQRATTALEAAGLVRKKSSEAVRDLHDRDAPKERTKDKDRDKGNDDNPRSSYASTSSKLTKSPPLKPTKGPNPPTTPPPSRDSQVTSSSNITSSPWIMTESKESLTHLQHHSSTVQSPIEFSSVLPPLPEQTTPSTRSKGGAQSSRNRANILTAFRLWFNDDRKGKRKDQSVTTPTSARMRPNGGPRGNGNGRRRGHRPSVSSRRSSSVNSRRSSIASVQMITLDSPPVHSTNKRSYTPNSENGGGYSSRPESVRSFSMQTRHRKSPSASSTGSAHYTNKRTASPMQKYNSHNHRRAGSGSSTRVVRQVQPPRLSTHNRSNSATSSVIASPVSSRPASFIDYSEGEGYTSRTMSPFKGKRSSGDDSSATPRRATTTSFVQKRHGPFSSPGYGSLGKSSWKKSWGLEPPGWQTRTAQLPVEVLAISPELGASTSIRDVFSGPGRTSISAGDESDWVDEDDDVPYAVGLGQSFGSGGNMSSKTGHSGKPYSDSMVTLGPPPRGHRAGKHIKAQSGSQNAGSGNGVTGRQKDTSPHPPEPDYTPVDTRPGRRGQLPATRAGPAAIQEEDEDEEED